LPHRAYQLRHHRPPRLFETVDSRFTLATTICKILTATKYRRRINPLFQPCQACLATSAPDASKIVKPEISATKALISPNTSHLPSLEFKKAHKFFSA
jgi:hypothetical protein